jgi:hypothetical protein
MFKAFLLYYMQKERESQTTIKEDDVTKMTKEEFQKDC